MFMRIDRLQTELQQPKKPEPNTAAALQELLGGKYGEISALGNYMFQSFNFRNKTKLRPFYSLASSIFAEEFGHVELVRTSVSILNCGPGNLEVVDPQGGKVPELDGNYDAFTPDYAPKDIFEIASKL